MGRPHDRRCPHLGSPNLKRSPVISSSYRNRLDRITITTVVPPPAFEADLEVKGTLTPDVTGDYQEAGVNDGQPFYTREDEAWTIWYDFFMGEHSWFITPGVDLNGDPKFGKTAFELEPVTGELNPLHGAIGTATVQLP